MMRTTTTTTTMMMRNAELENSLFLPSPPLFDAPARGDLARISGWNLPLYKLVPCRTLKISFFIMDLLGRPYGSTGSLLFCLRCFFLSPRVLQGPSAVRRETSPHDRKLAEFYNPSPKIRGPKHAKFRSILYNLRLWSRISPERLKISKIGKHNVSRSIPSAFYEKGLVNVGPQITEILMWVWTH